MPPNGGTVTYSTNPAVTAGSGISISVLGHPVELSIDMHGNIVGQAWFAIGDAAGRIGSTIESTMDDETYRKVRNTVV